MAADAVALAAATAANSAANRRFTFAQQGPTSRWQRYIAALAVALLRLVLTVAAVLAAGAAGVMSPLGALVILTAVNGLAAVARSLLLRRWVFR